MPLSPEEIQHYARQRLQLQQKTDLDRNRVNQDRTVGTRLLQEAGQRGQQQVGDQLASQGLFNSGIRVNEQGQVVREMNEGLGELNLNTGRTLEDLTRGLSTGLADIDFQESQATAQSARLEAEREQRRAELAAQAAAAASGGPGYPQPVISMPGAGAGGNQFNGVPYSTGFQHLRNAAVMKGNPVGDWASFTQAWPEEAERLVQQAGNPFAAAAAAMQNGWIVQGLQQRRPGTIPSRGVY